MTAVDSDLPAQIVGKVKPLIFLSHLLNAPIRDDKRDIGDSNADFFDRRLQPIITRLVLPQNGSE
jgi:hypothetical protein